MEDKEDLFDSDNKRKLKIPHSFKMRLAYVLVFLIIYLISGAIIDVIAPDIKFWEESFFMQIGYVIGFLLTTVLLISLLIYFSKLFLALLIILFAIVFVVSILSHILSFLNNTY